jgi:hypothetical protein
MIPDTPDQAVAELLNSMNKGQYLLFVEALRKAGGEVSIHWADFAAAAGQELPAIEVDASDGPVVLRLGSN